MALLRTNTRDVNENQCKTSVKASLENVEIVTPLIQTKLRDGSTMIIGIQDSKNLYTHEPSHNHEQSHNFDKHSYLRL